MRSVHLGLAVIVAAFCAPGLSARPALAWGPEAHRTIALIADRLLAQARSPARAKLMALLAGDKANKWTGTGIADEATWADVLRDKSQEARIATAEWHYVRLKADQPDLTRDCFGRPPLPAGYPASHGPQNNCAVDKILQFAGELAAVGTPSGEQLTALQFLLNLVGDLHDPLHTIDHGDRDGRCVALLVGTAKTPVRLASYWEAVLPGQAIGDDPAPGAAALAAELKPQEENKLAAGSPAEWARESYETAKTVVYRFATAGGPGEKYAFPTGKGETDPCGRVPLYKVGPEYEARGISAVRGQLLKAGVRLARVLRDGLK